jgi:hypothetical protein
VEIPGSEGTRATQRTAALRGHSGAIQGPDRVHFVESRGLNLPERPRRLAAVVDARVHRAVASAAHSRRPLGSRNPAIYTRPPSSPCPHRDAPVTRA